MLRSKAWRPHTENNQMSHADTLLNNALNYSCIHGKFNIVYFSIAACAPHPIKICDIKYSHRSYNICGTIDRTFNVFNNVQYSSIYSMRQASRFSLVSNGDHQWFIMDVIVPVSSESPVQWGAHVGSCNFLSLPYELRTWNFSFRMSETHGLEPEAKGSPISAANGAFSLENILGENHDAVQDLETRVAPTTRWEEEDIERPVIEGYCVECEGNFYQIDSTMAVVKYFFISTR